MIGQTISHYKILEKLGEGGMGAVYLAEDTNLGRKVAIKFLSADRATDPESRKRFIHEAKSQALVSHTNVASFHEVGEEGDKVFIVMEYIEGQKLSELAKTEKLPLPEVLDLTIQVGEGLQAAHERGVMHRDINPTNILVTAKRVAKITDFGLAKWKGASTITRTGLQMGTDSYMSPEQLEGRKTDYRTDIFSLGAVLYELICSRPPFEGVNRESLFYEILYTQPQPLARYQRGVPESLERVVSKCLAKKPEERYQSAADLVADLKKEKKSIESGERILAKPKKWLPFLVPAGIGLAVLLFLIFKPFSIEIGTEKESAAAENSLAIMYFENVADPEDKDKIAQMVTSLLITDLSESEYMRVVSQQRLYDVLKLLGKEKLKVVDKSTASEVAKKTGVTWILTGKVMQAKPNLLMTAEVSEAKGGKILASQKVSGTASQDLFAVVDKLSAEVKKDLTLPSPAKTEEDRPVAEVTTHSPGAYRYYLEGIDYWYKNYISDAEKSFKKALIFDSTFAMVYYWLGRAESDPRKQQKSRSLSLKYSDKTTKKERYLIQADAAFWSGNFAKAIELWKKVIKSYPQDKEVYMEIGNINLGYRYKYKESIQAYIKVTEIDPLFKIAYATLAYGYDEIGDFEKSIKAIDKYIALAPEEANPYDSKADIYAHNGRLDEAIELFKVALKKKPDFYWSLSKLGHLNLFKKDYFRAESCYKELVSCSDKDYRSQGRLFLAYVPLYQGKFTKALKILDRGITADEIEQVETWPKTFKYLVKAGIYEQQRDFEMAVNEAEKVSKELQSVTNIFPIDYRDLYITFLAESGDISRAEQAAMVLKVDVERSDSAQMPRFWYAMGSIQLARKQTDAAIANFENAAKEFPLSHMHFALARAYLENGRLGEAVAELEKLPSIFLGPANLTPLLLTPWVVKSYYLSGMAYEKSGWNQKAIKNYEEFLEIWKNADPGIAEVADARQRLARLKKKV